MNTMHACSRHRAGLWLLAAVLLAAAQITLAGQRLSPQQFIAQARDASGELRLGGLQRTGGADTWLTLSPVPIFTPDARVLVASGRDSQDWPLPEIRHFHGHERDDPAAIAFVSVHPDGRLRGWLQRSDRLEAFGQEPGERATTLALSRLDLAGDDARREFSCGSQALEQPPAPPSPAGKPGAQPPPADAAPLQAVSGSSGPCPPPSRPSRTRIRPSRSAHSNIFRATIRMPDSARPLLTAPHAPRVPPVPPGEGEAWHVNGPRLTRARALQSSMVESRDRRCCPRLAELRTMVGVLRASEGADLTPHPGVADLKRLADQTEGGPQVDVELSGKLDDLSPAVGAALYRLTQESVTNARLHARYATRVAVRVVGDAERVQLTVDDDGAVSTADGSPSGYGIVGMRERAKLLGGTFHAGPIAGGGWRVEAMLPRAGGSR